MPERAGPGGSGHGPGDEPTPPSGIGPAWAEEMPTMPPPTRAGAPTLRWATAPLPAAQLPTAQLPVTEAGDEHFVGEPLPGAGPGYGPGPAGAPKRGGRRKKLALIGLLAVLLVGGGTSAYLLASPASAPRKEGSGLAALPSLRGLESERPQVAFEELDRAYSQAEKYQLAAVADACATQPPGTAPRSVTQRQLSAAVVAQQEILALVRGASLRLSSMPQGTAVVGLLESLLAASLRAGSNYLAWVTDLQATGCYSAPNNNLHYLQALPEAATARRLSALLSATLGRLAK
ncbi:MAG TPA: hypothetical protein VME20_13590 [Acidimicrobiales bacterium]|nr:hypothetical protein [Acidimicrobiales bacterium]